MNKKEIESEIQNFISSKKEGINWDFKEIQHSNAADLIKDIICLANTPHYIGNRYLIFGLSDDGNVKGLTIDSQKKQADIIDTLRSAHFCNDIFPDIELLDMSIESKSIQVLIIKDLPYKPYFLIQDKKKDDKIIVRSGVIYSRNACSNTPSDKTASLTDIQKMWEERLGISQSPLERFYIYLGNCNDWIKVESPTEEILHYKCFPEFTIQSQFDKAFTEPWHQKFPDKSAREYTYHLKYHTTRLDEIKMIQIDGGRAHCTIPVQKSIPSLPESEPNWYYYLIKDTRNHRLMNILNKGSQHLKDFDNLFGVILFNNNTEQNKFQDWLSQKIKNDSEILFKKSKKREDVALSVKNLYHVFLDE